MPVLWQPVVETTLASLDPSLGAAYTLNIVTTQWIDVGILLRFQMWNGLTTTYYDAIGGNTLAEFELIVTTAIPPGTVVVVCMRASGTALYGYTGSETYATGGAGIMPGLFGIHNSLLCFAFAPTVKGAWTPARGRPMFAIGFNYAYVENKDQMGTGANGPAEGGGCAQPYTGPSDPRRTAPNFPDQYSGLNAMSPSQYVWTFIYEVVYPVVQRFPNITEDIFTPEWICVPVPGIKYQGLVPKYTAGSWTNLREIIAQPWTVIKDNYYSVSNWEWYTVLADYILPKIASPDVGPFIPSLMPGQLVPVYFLPKYKNIDTDNSPITTAPLNNVNAARLGMLVTSPIDAGASIFFTNQAYDADNGGFGPRNASTGTAIFINNVWSFQWHTPGNRVIPAGTVVVIDNIGGAGPITVYDAHDSTADVGVITLPYGGNINNASADQAVVGLIALGAWAPWGVGGARPLSASNFICAALSDQYAGDFPPLSPCLTINKNRFVGQVIFGRGRVFDNKNLPGTVQCAMINSANFTQICITDILDTNELPVFLGMSGFSW
jgi:hypothetical protein